MFKTRFISMLVLLAAVVTGAVAQEETLLTTIENTGDNASFTSGSKTFDNIATVTFSGNVNNDNDNWGWYSDSERTLTVTAAEGYTITRVKFYTDEGSAFDEEAPFEAILVGPDYIAKVNGTSIGYWGVNKIEVYGYAGTPAPAGYTVTVKDGTEDASNWQGKAGEGDYQSLPLEGVAEGTQVTLKYAGLKKVKSVKAKKKASAEPEPVEPTLAETLTTAGMTMKVNYNYNGEENYCQFLSNGDGTYTFQSGEGYVGEDDDRVKALVVEGGKLVFKQSFYDTIDFLWDSHGFSVTFDTGRNTYSQWAGKDAKNLFNPSFISVEVNGTEISLTQVITVTWNNDDITGNDEESFTKDGVTITAGIIDFGQKNFMQGGTFTTTLGNFTKIEVTADDFLNFSGTDWSGSDTKQTWTGNASSVSFSGGIMGSVMMGGNIKFEFTIEPTNAAPAETTVTWTSSDMTSNFYANFDGWTNNNTHQGITVTGSGDAQGGWSQNGINVNEGSGTITFTSSVGNIKSIVITADNMNEIDMSVPTGWTANEMWNNPRTLSWSGTASTTVDLPLSDRQNISDISTIVFTLE